MFGRNFDTKGNLKYQDENTVFKPQSPYAIAKVAAHMLVDNYRQSYGLFGCCGILFNHESERRGENFVTRKITKWIGDFVASGKSPDFPALRLGNLEARRDWGHAQDYVEAMHLMLQHEIPEDYVVSTQETHSIREFLHLAFGEIGIQNWEDYVVQDPEFYRPAEVDHLLGISEKARVVLGWEPKIEFRELVSRMVENDINEAELRRSRVQAV
jgi:GDPmannose 4,6-dehydratase